MAYIDEEILKLRQQQKKEKYNSIETGMYIRGEMVEFERQLYFNDKMSVMLPKSFVPMPLSIQKMKYPSEQRPQVIMTSLDITTNFNFSLLPQEMENDQTFNCVEQMKQMIKKLNPAVAFYDMQEIDREKGKLSWFDYKSYTIDEPLYNIMYVTPIDGKVMHGIFNCLYRYKEDWKEAALQVIASIWDTAKENRRL